MVLLNNLKFINKMKKILYILLATLSFGCADSALDPLQMDKLEAGALIALRGSAWEYLNTVSQLGEVDKFSLSSAIDETFDFDAEYVSKDKSTLSKVEVYALMNGKGSRVKITTIDGTTFKIPSDPKVGRYPAGKISIPLSTLLKALGKTKKDFVAGESYIQIQSDLVLTTGKTVSSSSIVNSSLFETTWFYPAHKLNFLAVE
jgi:hypothetical protein